MCRWRQRSIPQTIADQLSASPPKQPKTLMLDDAIAITRERFQELRIRDFDKAARRSNRGAGFERYSELDFDIPIGKHCDCYDRYLVRMEEMRQAVRIMKQCLDKLRSPDGQGPAIIEDHRVAPPRRPVMKRSMEAMIEHFKLYNEGFRVPKGEVYAAVEAPMPR
jgi:NADH:ubiquinone oxidoreductase subunit D